MLIQTNKRKKIYEPIQPNLPRHTIRFLHFNEKNALKNFQVFYEKAMKRYNVFRKEKKGEAITLIDTANYVSILPFSTSKINDITWIFRPSSVGSSVNIYRNFAPDI